MDMQSAQGQTSDSMSIPSSRYIANAFAEANQPIAPMSGASSPPVVAPTAINLPPPTSTQGSCKKMKAPVNKSPLWDHFRRCKLPEIETLDPKWCTCNHCSEKVLCEVAKNGTSSMHHHAKKCSSHPMYENRDSKQSKLIGSNVSRATTYHKYNKKRCDARCIEMIIKDKLPFWFVEKEGFLAFCKELEPNWKPMDRKQVAKGVLDKYNYEYE